MRHALALLLLATQLPSELPPDPNEVVVVGERPAVVVIGGQPRCRPLKADPYDLVRAPKRHRQSMIGPDPGSGAPTFSRDTDPILGATVWQRAGTGIGAYVFRAPSKGGAFCIGGTERGSHFGQLRQVLDAKAYRGTTVRFTAWVATSRVQEVRFWLAAGHSHVVLLGDDSRAQPLRGTHRWTPVSLTIGPVPRSATKLSYGFLLMGEGDMWVFNPTFEVLE